ncbi:MAG: MFS transporter [Maribacter sp.]|uniref:MFS transporter n=1 Tax=Maribacter sp. TaxID=1897614 RepID=UPI003C777A40
MELTTAISKRNFKSLLWHAGFLSLAQVFMDVDTIIPAMLVDAGGSAMQIGILTAIMLGGSSFTQVLYAPFVSNHPYKKKFLLLGINSRIFALLGLALMLYFSAKLDEPFIIMMIFVLISVFSFGGAFANVSYTDILGKSIMQGSRKSFFSTRQVITALILFFSALVAKKVLNLAIYPINYGHMFLIAFGALLISSLGFWNIKEVTPSRLTIKNPKHFYQLVKTELKVNKKLKYFLGFINSMGISTALLPFIILYAKEMYKTDGGDTGSFLLYKIIGSVVTGFVLFLLARRYKYRYLLYGGAALAFALPLFILLSSTMPSFIFIFFIGGIIYTAYTIAMNGVLLEVSGTENRTLYTGITGVGNILPALFPLVGGWIIKSFGFQPFFILYMAIILSSLFFIYRLGCEK